MAKKVIGGDGSSFFFQWCGACNYIVYIMTAFSSKNAKNSSTLVKASNRSCCASMTHTYPSILVMPCHTALLIWWFCAIPLPPLQLASSIASTAMHHIVTVLIEHTSLPWNPVLKTFVTLTPYSKHLLCCCPLECWLPKIDGCHLHAH